MKTQREKNLSPILEGTYDFQKKMPLATEKNRDIFPNNSVEFQDIYQNESSSSKNTNPLGNHTPTSEKELTQISNEMDILSIDCPERILIKNSLSFDKNFSEEEVKKEVIWLMKTKFKENNEYLNENFQKTLNDILVSYKILYNDIPFITTYMRDTYKNSGLKEDDIYKLLTLYDDEYNKISFFKTKLKENYLMIEQFVEEEEKNHFVDLYIEQQNSISDLKHTENYLNYIKNLNEPELDVKFFYQSNKHSKEDLIRQAKKNKIDEFVGLFTLNLWKIVENLKKIKEKNYESLFIPNLPENSPSELSSNFITNSITDEKKVIITACKFIAVMLSSHPYIRKFAYDIYFEHAYLSTEPTEKGEKELDIMHPSYRCKRIQKRPLKSFLFGFDPFEDEKLEEFGDIFLDISQCISKNLITMKIELDIEDSLQKEIIENFSLSMNGKRDSEEISNSYNLIRSEAVKVFFLEILFNEFINDIQNDLVGIGENNVIRNSVKAFERIISENSFEEAEYETVISLVYAPSNTSIYCAILDKKGKIIHSGIFPYLMLKPMIIQKLEEKQNHYSDIKKIKMLFKQTKKSIIVICANDTKGIKLKEIISSCFEEDNKHEIVFCDKTVPFLYANSNLCLKENSTTNNSKDLFFFSVAISQGRFIQNPIYEISHIWNEYTKSELFSKMNLHSNIHLITNEFLLIGMIENVIVKNVNKKGVIFNDIIHYNHFLNLLNFVCGLGQKRAEHILKLNESGEIISREELKNVLPNKIFLNANSFIFFSKSDNPLDMIKLNFDLYDLAKQILQINYPKENIQKILKSIISGKRSFDFNEFNEESISSIMKKLDDPKSFSQNVNWIIEQLKSFSNNTTKKGEILNKYSNEKIFLLMLNDPTFRTGIIKFARVINNDNITKIIECQLLNSELKATIKYSEIEENENTIISLYNDGYIFQSIIISIEIADDLYPKVELTAKKERLENFKFSSKEISLKKFENFKVIEEKDLIIRPNLKNEIEEAPDNTTNKLIYRKFEDNSIFSQKIFQNISYQEAISFLKSRNFGEFVFRPHYKGLGFIMLTFKVTDNVYYNIEIKEKNKNDQNIYEIGKPLQIGNDSFETFNDIIIDYLRPILDILRQVVNSKKIMQVDSLINFEKQILVEKNSSNNKAIIPFYFLLLSEYPNIVILGYAAKDNFVIFEPIFIDKVLGLNFHGQHFQDLNSVVNFFKKNFGNDEYLDYIKRMNWPIGIKKKLLKDLEFNAFEGEDPNKFKIKDWKIICKYCKKQGHNIKQCPVLKEKHSGEKVLNLKRQRDQIEDKEENFGWFIENKDKKNQIDSLSHGWGQIQLENNYNKIGENNIWKSKENEQSSLYL